MRRTVIVTGVMAIGLLAVGRAEAPRVFAIEGARVVTASGAAIAKGTVVLRDGLIEAVGASVPVPPEARVIDGSGLTVYPGLIDLNNTAATEIPQPEPLRNPRTIEEVERWKRSVLLRPQLAAVEHVKVDATDLTRLASAGITTVLAVPTGPAIRGRSALVNVVAPEDAPQIGSVADPRRGLVVVRTPVALHVEFTSSPRQGNAYPQSLMGVIAFVRQAFLDAQHHASATEHYARVKGIGVERPTWDPAIEGLQPAVAGQMPVAFEAGTTREILRALRMAEELGLDPIVVGGLEADETTADLKARQARVIYSLNYPARPRNLAPDADEPLRDLRARARAPRTPAALAKAGVRFAFGSSGLRNPQEFVKNAARAVKAGLAPDAAVRALTLDAARIAGVGDQLGSIERGKIANLIVTEGDLFDEKMKIRHVFVDGRQVPVQEPPAREEPGRRASGG
jgi:imidazolonepropionase-like amidohydrolase